MQKRVVTSQYLVAVILLVGCSVPGADDKGIPGGDWDKGAPGDGVKLDLSVPFSGIVKITSSYKAGETPGELGVEIAGWGNDRGKVTGNRENVKLLRKPAGGNPFRDGQGVKVGDYVVYKVTEKCEVFAAASGQAESTCTLTVSERDEKAASLEANGVLWTADLTKPFDMCTAVATIRTPGYGFIGLARNLGDVPFGFQKTREGKETIKIGKKTYDCTLIEGKVDTKVCNEGPPSNSYQFTADMKIWIANKVRAQP
jgi:hypothetical protein